MAWGELADPGDVKHQECSHIHPQSAKPGQLFLFYLAENLRAGFGNGDAEESQVRVQPEVPVRAVGLHKEMAKALGTSVERGVIVSLEFYEHLR